MIASAVPEDAREASEWMVANLGENDASSTCLEKAVIVKVDDVMYVPMHKVLMLGSLAPNPAANGVKRLLALNKFIETIKSTYDDDIYYLSRGGTKLDAAAEKIGFEELPYKVYRMRHGKG